MRAYSHILLTLVVGPLSIGGYLVAAACAGSEDSSASHAGSSSSGTTTGAIPTAEAQEPAPPCKRYEVKMTYNVTAFDPCYSGTTDCEATLTGPDGFEPFAAFGNLVYYRRCVQ